MAPDLNEMTLAKRIMAGLGFVDKASNSRCKNLFGANCEFVMQLETRDLVLASLTALSACLFVALLSSQRKARRQFSREVLAARVESKQPACEISEEASTNENETSLRRQQQQRHQQREEAFEQQRQETFEQQRQETSVQSMQSTQEPSSVQTSTAGPQVSEFILQLASMAARFAQTPLPVVPAQANAPMPSRFIQGMDVREWLGDFDEFVEMTRTPDKIAV